MLPIVPLLSAKGNVVERVARLVQDSTPGRVEHSGDPREEATPKLLVVPRRRLLAPPCSSGIMSELIEFYRKSPFRRGSKQNQNYQKNRSN